MKRKNPIADQESINRRRFLELTWCGFAGATAGTLISGCRGPGGKSGAGENSGKPNIVLIIADDMGWADAGYHGSEIRTPNIDRMAAQGAVLEHFYVCPTCSPTRASVLTGRPASRFGITEPIAGRSKQALPPGKATLGTLLQGAGYTTALAGKWHLGLTPDVGPRRYGFDQTYGYFHGQLDQYSHIYKNGDRTWHRNDQFIDEKGHATDLIAAEAVRFIREHGHGKPFFFYTAFSVPHYPVQEEAEWVKPYEGVIGNESRRLYAASMTHMDDAVGRILRCLEQENLAASTLVIFMSDNGAQRDWRATQGEYEGAYGPYDVLGSNEPLRDWKGSVYEGGIRVPAVFYWPGHLQPSKPDQVIAAIDILPTLAALAGARVGPEMEVEGINVWPSLTGQAPEAERTLYWNTGSQLALLEGRWKLIHKGGSLERGTDELYNLADDPYEKQDLCQENPSTAAALHNKLAEQLALDPGPE